MTSEVDANFSDQVIAVIDDGVWRGHEDFQVGLEDDPGPNNGLGIKGKVSWIGVNVHDDYYDMGTKANALGEPVPNPYDDDHVDFHGTAVAGTINAGTFNLLDEEDTLGVGTASLAPNALTLPLRLDHDSVDGYSTSVMIKAIRALRFEFEHGTWLEKVRVVNISISGNLESGWEEDFQDNMSHDLAKNDRLYVASAGENKENGPGYERLDYPAAYPDVLGVTGLKANWSTVHDEWLFTADPHSDYQNDLSIYPVSGIYEILRNGGFDLEFNQLVPYPDDTAYDAFTVHPRVDDYLDFSGNSSACPQAAALAFLLYDAKARASESVNYLQVRDRIITTAGDSVSDWEYPGAPLSGLIDFYAALENWGINGSL